MVTDNIHQHNHIMTPACCSTATVHATLWSKNGYFWYQTNYHDSNWNTTDVVPKCGVETQWMMSVLTSVFKTVVWTKQKNECWLFSGSSRGEERDEGDVGCRQRVHQSRNCKLAELTGHMGSSCVSIIHTHTQAGGEMHLPHVRWHKSDLALYSREHWMPELKSDSEALNNGKLHEMDGHDKSFYIKIVKREPLSGLQ